MITPTSNAKEKYGALSALLSNAKMAVVSVNFVNKNDAGVRKRTGRKTFKFIITICIMRTRRRRKKTKERKRRKRKKKYNNTNEGRKKRMKANRKQKRKKEKEERG